jgi:uncharacterized protein
MLSALWPTIGLLVLSNIFMNLAWYGHLKSLHHHPWWIAAMISWGIALIEYLLMVPANRLAYASGYDLGQLKVMQEALSLLVFVPVAVIILKEPLKLDYLWASLCLLGAVYFIFRSKIQAA